MVGHGPTGQLLALATTTIMTEHTPYNLQAMAHESHATDDTSNPHQSQQTHTYSTTQQKSHMRTDPLADILNNINKNSMAYIEAQTNKNSTHDG